MKTKDFLGTERDIDCMGCAIREGSMQVPGGFIKQTRHFFVHQDPLIPLPGFLVIASKRHIRSIIEMNDEEYEELSDLVRETRRVINETTQIKHLTMVQEERSVHFHLWFFPWTKEVIERYGEPSLTKIREIMGEYRASPISHPAWRELETGINKMRTQMDGY